MRGEEMGSTVGSELSGEQSIEWKKTCLENGRLTLSVVEGQNCIEVKML